MKRQFDIEKYLNENKIVTGLHTPLNELSSTEYDSMDVYIYNQKPLTNAVKSIYKKLNKEGFDDYDIIDYLHRLVEKAL